VLLGEAELVRELRHPYVPFTVEECLFRRRQTEPHTAPFVVDIDIARCDRDLEARSPDPVPRDPGARRLTVGLIARHPFQVGILPDLRRHLRKEQLDRNDAVAREPLPQANHRSEVVAEQILEAVTGEEIDPTGVEVVADLPIEDRNTGCIAVRPVEDRIDRFVTQVVGNVDSNDHVALEPGDPPPEIDEASPALFLGKILEGGRRPG
jgi:hypothetical protein